MTSVLATITIIYGVPAALSILLQARKMIARGGSCDVSARFLAAYVGGYAIWVLYGLSLRDVPIVVVDTLGLACGATTLAVALKLRGSLLSPASWNHCGTAATTDPTRAATPNRNHARAPVRPTTRDDYLDCLGDELGGTGAIRARALRGQDSAIVACAAGWPSLSR
jgi:hypothetical protein